MTLDPYVDKVRFLFDCQNNTPQDHVGHALLHANYGTVVATPSKFNQSVYELETKALYSDSEDYQAYSQDFTLELWYQPKLSAQGTHRFPIILFNPSIEYIISLGIDAGNQIAAVIGHVMIESHYTITAEEWLHIAVVRQGVSGFLFVNGVKSPEVTTEIVPLPVTRLIVGSGDINSIAAHGYIDSIRYTVGVARYLEDFTPPTTAFSDGFVPTRSVLRIVRVLELPEVRTPNTLYFVAEESDKASLILTGNSADIVRKLGGDSSCNIIFGDNEW